MILLYNDQHYDYYNVEWIERPLVAEQGTGITGHHGTAIGKTLDECKTFCVETDGCNSITWRNSGACWLKEKCLTEEEPTHEGNAYDFKSYYKPCAPPGMRILIHVTFQFNFYNNSKNHLKNL